MIIRPCKPAARLEACPLLDVLGLVEAGEVPRLDLLELGPDCGLDDCPPPLERLC